MKNRKKILLILVVILGTFLLTGCSNNDVSQAIGTGKFQFDDLFVYPMAGLMWVISKTIGFGSYGLVIIIATLVVRTIAWPIYAKTNDMSLKMTLVAPEAEKIKKKYEGKDDPQSQQKMQIETMQLYKKYGIGFGGCLLPFLQMPIFIGFYRTISRIPATLVVQDHWLNVFRTTKFLGIDLTQDKSAGGFQETGVIILAVLVGITQVISLLITQHRQKKSKEEQFSNVPAYRKPETPQQASTQKTMNVIMYSMAVMMVVFVLNSPAGLGLYWLIGNIYSTIQSQIGHKNSQKRLEVLRNKH